MVALSYLLVLLLGILLGSLRPWFKSVRAEQDHRAQLIQGRRERQLMEIETERRQAEEAMRRAVTDQWRRS